MQTNHVFFLHSLTKGHLCLSHILSIVNVAAINMAWKYYFGIKISSLLFIYIYMYIYGNTGLYGSSILVFEDSQYFFHNGSTGMEWFTFLPEIYVFSFILASMLFLFFNDSHCDFDFSFCDN
jgi:hypothetical protein